MVFVFLWLISLSVIPSSSIHVVTNGTISCDSCVFMHSSTTLFRFLDPIPMHVCWQGGLPMHNTNQFLNTSRVSKNSAQF